MKQRYFIGVFPALSASCVQNENLRSFLVAVFYGLVSISMNFLNKTIVSSYEFNFPYFIMTCQVSRICSS